MLTNETISKLQDMRLGVMAKQFRSRWMICSSLPCPLRTDSAFW